MVAHWTDVSATAMTLRSIPALPFQAVGSVIMWIGWAIHWVGDLIEGED